MWACLLVINAVGQDGTATEEISSNLTLLNRVPVLIGWVSIGRNPIEIPDRAPCLIAVYASSIRGLVPLGRISARMSRAGPSGNVSFQSFVTLPRMNW